MYPLISVIKEFISSVEIEFKAGMGLPFHLGFAGACFRREKGLTACLAAGLKVNTSTSMITARRRTPAKTDARMIHQSLHGDLSTETTADSVLP